MTCSEKGDIMIGGAFNLSPERYIHGMYPRNYYLSHDIPLLLDKEKEIIKRLISLQEKGKRILFYLPTFRKEQIPFLGTNNEEERHRFFDLLKGNDYIMVSKMHFYGAMTNHDKINEADESVINLPPETDIYPFLKMADILITDYSSVLFDFLYLDRPIICYAYDMNQYKQNDRGLLLDYEKLPAQFAFTLEELIVLLSNLSKGAKTDGLSQTREAWLDKYWGNMTIDHTIKNILEL